MPPTTDFPRVEGLSCALKPAFVTRRHGNGHMISVIYPMPPCRREVRSINEGHCDLLSTRHLSHSPSALVGRENAPYEVGKVDRRPFPASQRLLRDGDPIDRRASSPGDRSILRGPGNRAAAP